MRFLILVALWLALPVSTGYACLTDLGRVAPEAPGPSRKLYRPLFSSNTDALKMMKINKTYPATNMFLMPPEKWLAPDAEFKEQMELRARLYKNRPQDIMVVDETQEPRVRAAAEELLGVMANHLVQQFPETYGFENGNIVIKPLGTSFSLTDHSEMPALAKVGLLAQDDITFSLIAPNNGPVTMYGGFLATPTHWAMQDFISMPVHEIHGGIPGYEEKLKKAVEGTITGHGGKIMGRNNWFIESNPELALPSYRTSTYKGAPVTEANVADTLFLRSELESIFVLPNSKAAVFTIRPRVWKMSTVKEGAPEISQQISEALPTSQYAEEWWAAPLARQLHTGVVAEAKADRPGPPTGVILSQPPPEVMRPSAPQVPVAPKIPEAIAPEPPSTEVREPQALPAVAAPPANAPKPPLLDGPDEPVSEPEPPSTP